MIFEQAFRIVHGSLTCIIFKELIFGLTTVPAKKPGGRWSGNPMAQNTILDHVIPAREYTSLKLHHGETLRVIDLEGKQVVDLVALSATDKDEKLSCVYSNILNGTWKLTKGHTIYSNRANPILFIKEDKVGLHYSGGGFCTEEMNYVRFKDREMPNCAHNLPWHSRPTESRGMISTLTVVSISS